jgi:hypothetical protein
MDCKRGRKSRDFYTLMFLLPSLRKLNIIIQEQIRNELPNNIEYPAFFSRVYLNEQDIVSFRINHKKLKFSLFFFLRIMMEQF